MLLLFWSEDWQSPGPRDDLHQFVVANRLPRNVVARVAFRGFAIALWQHVPRCRAHPAPLFRFGGYRLFSDRLL